MVGLSYPLPTNTTSIGSAIATPFGTWTTRAIGQEGGVERLERVEVRDADLAQVPLQQSGLRGQRFAQRHHDGARRERPDGRQVRPVWRVRRTPAGATTDPPASPWAAGRSRPCQPSREPARMRTSPADAGWCSATPRPAHRGIPSCGSGRARPPAETQARAACRRASRRLSGRDGPDRTGSGLWFQSP